MKKIKQPCWVETPKTEKERTELLNYLKNQKITHGEHCFAVRKDLIHVYVIDNNTLATSYCSLEYAFNAIKNTYPELKIPKEEYKFTVFEEVLVRDNNEAEWLPKHFSRMGRPKDYYKYIVTSGTGYNHCIPYEGNERLVYTNNKPK